jgi:hypothetical protein
MFKSVKIDRCNIIVTLVALEMLIKEDKKQKQQPWFSVKFKRGDHTEESEKIRYSPLDDDDDEIKNN